MAAAGVNARPSRDGRISAPRAGYGMHTESLHVAETLRSNCWPPKRRPRKSVTTTIASLIAVAAAGQRFSIRVSAFPHAVGLQRTGMPNLPSFFLADRQ